MRIKITNVSGETQVETDGHEVVTAKKVVEETRAIIHGGAKYKMTWLCGHKTEEEVVPRDQGYQEDPEIAISGFQETGKTLLCPTCSAQKSLPVTTLEREK